MDSVLFLQLQCLRRTFFKREVTLKVSEIYDEVLLLNFKFFMLSKVYCYYYYFYCIIYYYNALFSETLTVQYLYMVYFTSSKEMFQNTEEFVQKGTFKTVCHGTSVNVICYMAQQRK